MAIGIGINGFGRIGRQVLRVIYEQHAGEIEVRAANDLTDAKTNAHLLRYDSNYGAFPGKVEVSDTGLVIDGRAIRVFSERDPGKIPWRDVGVDIVIESTGHFTNA